jgi:hypothetical protein
LSSGAIAVVQSFNIKFLSTNRTADCSERTIEVIHNDEYGFPILGFSSDSQWVKISLDCKTKINPPVGWVFRYSKWRTILLWHEYFHKGYPIRFRKKDWIAFYSEPDTTMRITPHLVGGYSSPDYSMRVRETQGDWMKVDLETPSTFMHSPKDVAHSNIIRISVWIQFMDHIQQLRIWGL